MSTPNPLIPQGTFPEKGKSHVRIAVFTILAIHLVLLIPLLIAGCKKTEETPAGPDLSSITNMYPPPPLPEPTLVMPVSEPLIPATPPPEIVQPTPPPFVPVPDPIPELPPEAIQPPEIVPTGREHVVVRGDSFYELARKYNTSMKAIAEMNPGVEPTRLKIGQKLRIPAASPARGNTGTPAGVNGGSAKTYTVRSGDNLSKIARRHDTTVRALRSANNLRTDQIRVGQKLQIPAKASVPSRETEPATPLPPSFP